MKILIVPLDDRPVTYIYPQLVARLAGLEPVVPPRNLMGSLTRSAHIDELFNFVENTLRHEPDCAVIALDSLLYGGLITSRRSNDALKTILARLDRVKKWKELSAKRIPIFCQSSIMRISDNYDNTEEKEYWARFGRELFEWSGCMHRLQSGEKVPPGLLQALERRIPADIRQDYLATRFRNFSVNQAALKAVEEGSLEHITFSQDDSGAWGLNVGEKNRLVALAEQAQLNGKVSVYAGADEVTTSLIARFITQHHGQPKVAVHFSPDGASAVASRYEGQDIGTTTVAQLKASGVKFSMGSADSQSDITMIVHGPREKQGDHITLPSLPDLSTIDTSQSVAATLELIETAQSPVMLCDVAYANGGDPMLVEELIKRPELLAKLSAYGGWNTTGNTIGAAIATAVAEYARAKATADSGKEFTGGAEYKKRCLFTRLVDDWAYQTRVRKELDGEPSTQKLGELISPYVKQVMTALNFEPSVRLSFPWRRTFEIEIGFEGN